MKSKTPKRTKVRKRRASADKKVMNDQQQIILFDDDERRHREAVMHSQNTVGKTGNNISNPETH